MVGEWIDRIKKCDGSQASIDDISRGCLSSCSKNEIEVAKMLQDMLSYERYDLKLKLNILQIMTRMLINDPSKNYYRHLPSRIYHFISKYRISHIYNDQPATLTLARIFQKWRQSRVFADEFYERLVESCGQLLMEKIYSYFQKFALSRYNRKFIENIKDVRKVRIAQDLYDNHVLCVKLNRQLQSLKQKVKEEREKPSSVEKLKLLCDKLIQLHANLLLDWQEQSKQLMTLFKHQAFSLGLASTAQLSE